MPDDELEALLCIHLTERLGTATHQRLLDHFGSTERILKTVTVTW